MWQFGNANAMPQFISWPASVEETTRKREETECLAPKIERWKRNDLSPSARPNRDQVAQSPNDRVIMPLRHAGAKIHAQLAIGGVELGGLDPSIQRACARRAANIAAS